MMFIYMGKLSNTKGAWEFHGSLCSFRGALTSRVLGHHLAELYTVEMMNGPV